MLKTIIKIDEAKCIGCGLCASTCHQGAIKIIDKKAKLIHDDYCDGLGRCLPVCPTNAITLEEVDVVSKSNKVDKGTSNFVCPSSVPKKINKKPMINNDINYSSNLTNWPIQIKLVPVVADYYDNANLLIAADCASFAYANFNHEFMKNRVTLIGCPKLDEVDYQDKLTDIIANNDIRSVTIVRMEVPCCGGIFEATKNALMNSGKMIPWNVVIISTDGEILEN